LEANINFTLKTDSDIRVGLIGTNYMVVSISYCDYVKKLKHDTSPQFKKKKTIHINQYNIRHLNPKCYGEQSCSLF